nr:histidine kinase [uncultured Microbacterium sp.]
MAFIIIGLALFADALDVAINTPTAAGFLALVISAVGAVVSRKWEWVGLALTLAAPALATLIGLDPTAHWTVAIATLFVVTLRGLPAVVATPIAAVVVYFVVVWAEDGDFSSPLSLIAFTSAVAAGATGGALRVQQRYVGELEQRALDAMNTREIEARRRVSEERLRIARDLHDVVGHEVATISVHLGVAEVRADPDDATVRAALGNARNAVSSVLLETQRILEILRRGDGTELDLAPAPGYEQLHSLLDSYRSIGLTVQHSLVARPKGLDPTVGLAVFRIVQEGLTNAQKHGNGAVEVRISVEGDLLIVNVSNGRPTPKVSDGASAGYGLVGMQERATSAGGTLVVSGDGTTHTVTATLRVNGGAVK